MLVLRDILTTVGWITEQFGADVLRLHYYQAKYLQNSWTGYKKETLITQITLHRPDVQQCDLSSVASVTLLHSHIITNSHWW